MKGIHKTRLMALNGKKLLVIEKIGYKKRLTLPGGIKKKNETLQESLVRETQEEIGLKIKGRKKMQLLSSTKLQKGNLTKHHFMLFTKTNNFKVCETQKFKQVYWLHWKKAIDFLDREDRQAVKKYFKSDKNLQPEL